MSSEKVIGVEQESKEYSIAGYTIKMIPLTELTLPEADRVLHAIGSIGKEAEGTFIQNLIRVYGNILKPVLRIEDPNWWARIIRILRGRTPLKVLGTLASAKEVGTIIQDFFAFNFGSTQPSDRSFVNSILSLSGQMASRASMISSTPSLEATS